MWFIIMGTTKVTCIIIRNIRIRGAISIRCNEFYSKPSVDDFFNVIQ